MIDQAATAIVTAEHGANDRLSAHGNTAEARVVEEILFYSPLGISLRYLNAFGCPPNGKRLAKVGDAEFPCENR